MVLLTQSPNGALSSSSILPFSNPNPSFSLFSRSRSKLPSSNPSRKPPPPRTLTARPHPTAKRDPTARPLSSPPPPRSSAEERGAAAPSSSETKGQVGLLAGGDVLCLLLFSAIGRFSHGFPVLDFETLKTADPFIAGWFLGAYFLGAYGDDGKGLNGTSKAITATAKSWLVGIPLGIVVRAATSGHIPSTAFMLVSMGSTGILLIGWRALISKFLPSKQTKKSDVYKRGSAFELFEDIVCNL
ncbi:uncharacterized protein A4U43_C03F23380 [Asparagus officinalis]|uniref:Uncharacterized protein n=1 Tax=Asparagus officinalis TaxID=4686 RepID=A0A5P1FE93_ASPOF|nr:uncharacterized protein A4U43_C03F23380 [Asparagus officinalis]